MRRAHRFLFIISIMASLLCLRANALPEDQQQPMRINANNTQFNYKTGINTYEGNVIIDQGTTHITADRVVTKNNAQHKIEEAIAYGYKEPAVYLTIPKVGDTLFTAKATTIMFYPFKSMVRMEGNVAVTQGDNSFHGPVIIYNIKDQVVLTPVSKDGRMTLVIKPE